MIGRLTQPAGFSGKKRGDVGISLEVWEQKVLAGKRTRVFYSAVLGWGEMFEENRKGEIYRYDDPGSHVEYKGHSS